MSEIIEMERNAAKKKKREMEKKRKENEQEAYKFKWDQRETDDEVDGSKKDHSPEDEGHDGTQETAGGAPEPIDSFHPQENNMTGVQDSNSQCLTTKVLDESGEVQTGQAGGSTKESHKNFGEDFAKQVTKNHFEEKKVSGKYKDERLGNKQMPRACKLLSWGT